VIYYLRNKRGELVVLRKRALRLLIVSTSPFDGTISSTKRLSSEAIVGKPVE